MNIHFKKADLTYKKIIFSWLEEPHVKEFWDSSQAYKDDIVNFIEGRKIPSDYAGGEYVYWIAQLENEPFAMLMTIPETEQNVIDSAKLSMLSKTGNTYSIDYMIGNYNYFGKGYGAKTLAQFIDYFCEVIDPKADTFLIDPACDNPRAKHVYMKAGFKHVCDFIMEGNSSSSGKLHHLLVKRIL